jgi:hypothetical protein
LKLCDYQLRVAGIELPAYPGTEHGAALHQPLDARIGAGVFGNAQGTGQAGVLVVEYAAIAAEGCQLFLYVGDEVVHRSSIA